METNIRNAIINEIRKRLDEEFDEITITIKSNCCIIFHKSKPSESGRKAK